jgi:serine kinase of HPr protein (carbohydrate metabolism regulator)
MRPNIHGTALLIGDRGVVITGASGAGKSTLALALAGRFASRWTLCRLVSDDQLLVTVRQGRVICRAPPAIAAKVEVRGIGPQAIPFEPAMVADMLVRLVPAAQATRLQEDGVEVLGGVTLPRIDVPERAIEAAVAIVAARLGLAPFA